MAALYCAAVLPVAAQGAAQPMERATLLSLSASVLKIEARRAQGGFAFGSGVVVAPEQIVTNCHVTRDAVQISVLRGGVRWAATAQRSDLDHDLCLLRVPGVQATPATIGRADRLRPGAPVAALGYTGGMGMQSSQGEVIGLHRLDGGAVIQSSNWFSSGASGGGLFDEQLNLVGILTFRLRGAEAHYFAAPAEWLAPLLDASTGAGWGEVAPERSLRLPYWQQPAAAQPRFLRAAALQRDSAWDDLEALAVDWARSDAGDPEPWYLLGLALVQTGRLAPAEQALGCALDIAPAFAPALASMAFIRSRGAATAGSATSTDGRPCMSGPTSTRSP